MLELGQRFAVHLTIHFPREFLVHSSVKGSKLMKIFCMKHRVKKVISQNEKKLV